MYKSILVITILMFSLNSLGQLEKSIKTKSKPPAKPVKPSPPKIDGSWYVAYKLEIKGKVNLKDEPSEGDNEEWTIDRTYTGRITLDQPLPYIDPSRMKGAKTPAEMQAIMEGGDIQWTHAPPGGKNPRDQDYLLPIQVVIHDKFIRSTHEKGEGGSFENATYTWEWNGDCEEFVINEVKLNLFKNSTYEIFLPSRPFSLSNKKNVTKTLKIHYSRSSFGYGDLPTEEDVPEKTEKVAASEFEIPEVKDFIKISGVIHNYVEEMKLSSHGDYEYDSGPLEANTPVIKGVQRSLQKGVKVSFYYHFAKNK